MMATLTPAVRDLLLAIADATHAAEHADYPVCAIATACQSALRYGDDWDAARWLRGETAELADRRRVAAADTHGMLAEHLVSVRPEAVRS